MNYKNYLNGSYWREFRKQALEYYGMRCADCGEKKGRFDIHHLTYERFGKEELSDVAVLCHSCHRKRHEKEPMPYNIKPYICEHKTLVPAVATTGDIIMYYWQCDDCMRMFEQREPSEDEKNKWGKTYRKVL